MWKNTSKVATLDYDYSNDSVSGEKTSLIYLPLVPPGSDYYLRLVSLMDENIFTQNATPFTITSQTPARATRRPPARPTHRPM